MDIEIKHKMLRDRDFNSGLAKLSRWPNFNPRQLYNVARIVEKIRQADKNSGELWQKMIEPYIQKDVEGKIIPDKGEDGKDLPNTFAIPDEKKGEFQKKVEEFHELEFKIKRNKIPVGDLEGVGLNANELIALEPLIHGLEIVEGEENGKVEKGRQETGQEETAH